MTTQPRRGPSPFPHPGLASSSRLPTLLLIFASVCLDPPLHLRPRPHLYPHGRPQPQPQLGRIRPVCGAWETRHPLPVLRGTWIVASVSPASQVPKVPGFSGINFPGTLLPYSLPHYAWHARPGGRRGSARPLRVCRVCLSLPPPIFSNQSSCPRPSSPETAVTTPFLTRPPPTWVLRLGVGCR